MISVVMLLAPTRLDANAAATTSHINPRELNAQRSCETAFIRYGTAWRPLRQALNQEQPDNPTNNQTHDVTRDPAASTTNKTQESKDNGANINPAALALSHLDLESCKDPATRKLLVASLADVTSVHTGSIGIFLPMRGPRSSAAQNIVHGIRQSLGSAWAGNTNRVTIVDTTLGPDHIRAALADILYRQDASLMIHLPSPQDGVLIRETTQKVGLPLLELSAGSGEVLPSNVFRIWPRQAALAEVMVQDMVAKGIKRLAIVRPGSAKSVGVAAALKEYAAARGINVVHDLTYVTGAYESMESASRTLLNVDPVTRRGDFAEEMRRARQRALSKGVTFNPRMVTLKPEISFDAVFIPDDFRTVRHLVKILQYHGLRRTHLYGNHEWRSQGLVDPWDAMFEGATFADFIGSYHHLPQGVMRPPSPWFADPSLVEGIDFQMIGHQTGGVVRELLTTGRHHRRQLTRALRTLRVASQPGGLKDVTIFNEDQSIRWNAHLFRVADRSIIPVNIPAIVPTLIPAIISSSVSAGDPQKKMDPTAVPVGRPQTPAQITVIQGGQAHRTQRSSPDAKRASQAW